MTAAAVAERQPDETGWLIELKGQTPQWAVINPSDYDEHWTNDASKAIRFAREQDAQAYIDHIGWTEAFPTEHMWCGPRAALSDTGGAAAPAVAEPVAWRHELDERNGNFPQIVLSQSPDNPWSHWLQAHRDKCEYRCTPLYATPQDSAALREALEAAFVAMSFARAIPGVSQEYDFDPALDKARAALSPKGTPTKAD